MDTFTPMGLQGSTDELIGQAIQRRRLGMGWSQAEMASRVAACGVQIHQQTILKIEKGTRPLKIAEYYVFAEVLEVDAAAFWLEASSTADQRGKSLSRAASRANREVVSAVAAHRKAVAELALFLTDHGDEISIYKKLCLALVCAPWEEPSLEARNERAMQFFPRGTTFSSGPAAYHFPSWQTRHGPSDPAWVFGPSKAPPGAGLISGSPPLFPAVPAR